MGLSNISGNNMQFLVASNTWKMNKLRCKIFKLY